MAWDFETVKSIPSDPVTYLLNPILHQQFHQLGSKNSNTWAYGVIPIYTTTFRCFIDLDSELTHFPGFCLQLGGVKTSHSQRWYILLDNWCTVFLFPLWNRRDNCLFSQHIQVYTIQSNRQVLRVWHIWRKDMEETVSLEHRSALPFVPQNRHVHWLIA